MQNGHRLTAAALAGLALVASACSASSAPARHTASASPATTSAPSTSADAPATASSTSSASSSSASPTHRATPTATPTHHHAAARTVTHAASLPLRSSTGSARQVVTVTASSTSRTVATLQAWRKVSGGWRVVGPSVTAHLGSDGLSKHPSESRSATPIGSFTLTQAFGHDADPGTALPYTHTTPDDWWISQPGRLYNTRQRCASDCAFTRGDPNEHLYYETPYYDYAVVIDYNTRNAPGGVRQGAGSAFFLHVTDGHPTAGCVSIPMSQLTRIMRWLQPADHPRIVIGVA